jgi:hypothetical protein
MILLFAVNCSVSDDAKIIIVKIDSKLIYHKPFYIFVGCQLANHKNKYG